MLHVRSLSYFVKARPKKPDRVGVGTTVSRLFIIIPAFNEAGSLARTLADLRPLRARVIVVDDGSKDGTSDVARSSGAVVLTHVLNLGQGAALQTGIDYALEAGAEQIVTFDADGQHDPCSILAMVELATRTGSDVILGSRFLGSTVAMSVPRRLLLRTAVAFTRIQTGLALTDTHNGLRLLSRMAASRIRIRQAGMAHASEILTQIARERLSFVEMPTTIRYTEYSKRKGQRLTQSVRILFDLFCAAWSR